ncbi:hypothetical protein RSOLAG22IIIB_08893 [Rhizoctonia solani]|uniref:Uncharacterized protein n=1 Tax=Rhizoctonia solani TaxID=456999 RepID=A0A0K6FW15_9AGAM|nr:hypothetical protein RSOLAG22IIIB_08893 [Rhizoctonia solani]
MPPKRAAPAKSTAPPAPKRSRRIVSSDTEDASSPVAKASTAPLTPASAPRPRGRPKTTSKPQAKPRGRPKKIDTSDEDETPASKAPKRGRPKTTPRKNTDEDEDDGDDESEAPASKRQAPKRGRPKTTARNNTDEDEDNGDDDGDDESEAPAPQGRRARGKARAKPAITEKDAFSRGFFRALMPAADTYYNKESNLIRLRCAEYHTQKSTAEAKIEHLKVKQEYLMALREEEIVLTGDSLIHFRKSRADDSELALLKVQSAFKALEVSKAKYESDIVHMRAELEKRKQQATEAEAHADNTDRLAVLAGIKNRMINGGV